MTTREPKNATRPSERLEKKGGYPSPAKPLAKLPRVPSGPAPGGARPQGKPSGI